jgi:hypothetical protein
MRELIQPDFHSNESLLQVVVASLFEISGMLPDGLKRRLQPLTCSTWTAEEFSVNISTRAMRVKWSGGGNAFRLHQQVDRNHFPIQSSCTQPPV